MVKKFEKTHMQTRVHARKHTHTHSMMFLLAYIFLKEEILLLLLFSCLD
jgi:hypothetical protein